MPIKLATLEAPENRFLRLSAAETLRGALRNLITTPPRAEPWHYLVAQRSNGTWLAVRFSWLVDLAEEDHDKLDLALGELQLGEAQVVERGEVGTGEAQRMARSAPGRVVVVMEAGQLVGIVCQGSTRAGSFSVGVVEELVGSGQPKLETRYTDIGCPQQVTLETPRFQVTVRLTLQRPEWSEVVGAVQVDPKQVVRVKLGALDFEQLNSDLQEIPLKPEEDSPTAVFDLKPRKLGRFPISLDFFQGSNHLGTARFEVEVTAKPNHQGEIKNPSLALILGSPTPAPDRILRVCWAGDQSSFRLTLIEAGATAWHDFPPTNLGKNPSAYLAAFLEDIREWSQRADTADLGGLEKHLQKAGFGLWKLLHPDFQRQYLAEKESWRGSSLLILSDEPFVPWELVWPYGDDGADDGPWCLSLKLSRWLCRSVSKAGNLGAQAKLSLARMACVAPKGMDLPAARKEQELLRRLSQQHGLHDVSPDPPSWEELMDLLERGNLDWLHIATHADFDDEGAQRRSVVRLSDGQLFKPADIIGPQIEATLRRDRPAFFFNACHAARLGWDWGGLAGWADQLLGAGAGLFLAPLWAVSDGVAKRFVETLYPHLLDGVPIAEAVRLARLEARKEGDASWLAYSLYAHPNARVHASGTSA